MAKTLIVGIMIIVAMPTFSAAAEPKPKLVLEGLSEVHALAVSPDGKTVAAAEWMDKIYLWDLSTGKARHDLRLGSGALGWYARTLAFTPDGKILVAAGQSDDKSGIRFWDMGTGKVLGTLPGHGDGLNDAAISPDGSVIATGGYDKFVRRWDVATRKELAALPCDNPARRVVFAPGGKTLASGEDAIGNEDGLLHLWDAKTGKSLRTMKGHANGVLTLAYAPDGKLLASAGHDKVIRLWEPATGAAKGRLAGHADSVYALAFSPDGKTLASGGQGGQLRLWDSATGKAIASVEADNNYVAVIAYSPDGKLLIEAGSEGGIRLWDPAALIAAGK